MKHFSDDGCNRRPEHDEPEFGVHIDEDHDPMKDYENHIAGPHYKPDPNDWYEGIKHFGE